MADGIKILQSLLGPRDFTPDIQVDGEKCAARCHKRSNCRTCIEMCPAHAIELVDRQLSIDYEACTHCGACVTVCPTEAISSAWQPRKKLVADALHAVETGEGAAVLFCEKVHEEGFVHQSGRCAAICLEIVDEALLLSMVAAGARRIKLVHGGCATCETGCCGAAWSLVVDQVTGLLRSVGSDVELVIEDATDEKADLAGEPSVSRREALSGIGGSVARVAADVAEEVVRESRYGGLVEALGLFGDSSAPGHSSRGQISAWALGAIALGESGGAREALEHLGSARVPTRVFGEPTIDTDACSNCFLCTAYCREHAIEKLKDGPKVRGFRIAPHLCNGCGLCADVCRPAALTINHNVELAAILQERIVKVICGNRSGEDEQATLRP